MNNTEIVQALKDNERPFGPDYKEPQEVVECKIEPDDVRGLYCMDNEGEFCFLYAVTANPDFIGFKYEDETIDRKIWSVPRLYRVGEGEYSVCGNVDGEVLTPTAVLFKEKDNG